MKKLTHNHVDAVGAAKLLLIYKATCDQPSRYRAVLERQIELLGEVNWWILNSIYHPGLQFNEEPEPEEEPKPEKPQDNGTAARH